MLLKELLNKSVYGTIGYVKSQDDIDLLESYILYNLKVLEEFKQIVVATNYGAPLQVENSELWKKYFPDCIIIDSQLNRGHNYGNTDLDNLIFEWCKENNEEWLCKGVNDIILDSKLFEIEVEEADFYYMNGFSFETIFNHKMDLDYLDQNHFTPQTNFYIINISKTDYLNNKEYLSETYDLLMSIPNFNGKPWEYIKGWSCEEFLALCISRNNLTKYNLFKGELYEKLFNLIKLNKIGDPSHKNIMIQGICHHHPPNQSIIELNLEH